MGRSVTFALGAVVGSLIVAGCGSSTSTADKVAASAKIDYHASDASCSPERHTARLQGQRFDVYDCLISGVGEIFRPPGVQSASFRRCYVYNQGPVEIPRATLRNAARRVTFGCLS